MTWRGSTTPANRFFACLPYLLPLIESLAFGRYIFQQFPALQIIFVPLAPVISLYASIPFAGLIIFFGLLFGVVRNERINHFIRFNTMQAILLSIAVIISSIVTDWVLMPLNVALLTQTLASVIFLGVMIAVIYSVAQSVMGRYADIPTLSEAAYVQVR